MGIEAANPESLANESYTLYITMGTTEHQNTDFSCSKRWHLRSIYSPLCSYKVLILIADTEERLVALTYFLILHLKLNKLQLACKFYVLRMNFNNFEPGRVSPISLYVFLDMCSN